MINHEADHKCGNEQENHNDKYQINGVDMQASSGLHRPHDRRVGNKACHYCEQEGAKHDDGADGTALVRIWVVKQGFEGSKVWPYTKQEQRKDGHEWQGKEKADDRCRRGR